MEGLFFFDYPNHALIVLDKNLLESIFGGAVEVAVVGSRGSNISKSIRRTCRHNAVYGSLLAAYAHLVIAILACKNLKLNRERKPSESFKKRRLKRTNWMDLQT